MIVIPSFQDVSARTSFDIELDLSIYHLKFAWNSRESSWYMTIQDQDEIDILTGIKMVPNYLLLDQYKYLPGLPPGDFFLFDLNQIPENEQPDFDNLGKRYQLLYIIEAEYNGEAPFGIQ